MKSFRKIISGLIGFDRRERRGSYILSILLLLLLLIRVIALRPGNEPVNTDLIAPGNISMQGEAAETGEALLFRFDPNTVSFDELLRLGLTERQATTLINYRSAGARFEEPGDIRRVYGIDSAEAVQLMPWISIKETADDPVGTEKIPSRQTIDSVVTAEEPPVLLLDINLCSAADLLLLPGIGPVLSERIIKYRKLLGGFVATGQLTEVYGLDSVVFSHIEERLTVTFDSVGLLMLDSCSYSEMARHPYIGPVSAGLIMKYRSLMGRPVTLGDLVSQHLLTHEQAIRFAPYIKPSEGVKRDDYEFISTKVLK
ncbi:MAG: helix-hairpin-helix domain-containing protein [Bacteroidales bacterium]|nr:helix-hairpin-helix domain-containing protein [Bacteroidales bacterium]